MQALNNNATMTRSIYSITQNILQEDIGNHSLILLQTTEYYKRELDEPMAPHNVTLNVLLNKGNDSIIWGSNNINSSMTIKLGEFNIHMKHGKEGRGDESGCFI